MDSLSGSVVTGILVGSTGVTAFRAPAPRKVHIFIMLCLN